MMMNKTRPSEAADKEAAEKPKGPSDAVADLERRLAMLGDSDPPPPMSVAEAQQPPAFATPPPAAASAPAATGKGALLARIMAAQERAKQAKPKEVAPPIDLLSAAPPAVEDTPPPAFDDAALFAPPTAPPPPQQEEAPPAFDLLEDTFDMKPPPAVPAAPPSYATAPPAPSAPTFEDLLGGTPSAPPPPLHGMEQLPPPPMPPAQEMQPPPPPQQSIEEEFAAALEGLSEEEKASLLAEQRQIMAQIEQDKASGASALSAADRFDQRSNAAVARIAGGENRNVRLPGAGSSATAAQQRTVKLGENQEVALHGQERTRAAIADGTAILVQCVNCGNWMQVTDNATLMFCPLCQVVSPVDRDNAVTTKEEALQMEADRKLAEELQKEEYTAADRQERRQRRAQQQQQQQQQQQSQAKSESWWDWLGLGGGSAAAARPQTQTQSAPQYRGDMGVSRPPGAAAAGLQAAQTGEITFSSSQDAEDRSLLDRRAAAGGARVAESKPLFACVADSITTAASSFSTAVQTQTLTHDEEGNVHGVDGSSLLVVSQAGRNQNQG